MPFEVQAGARLSEERERLRMSQQGLADACGIARTMLSRYERAVTEPGAGSLIALASHGVDVQYVLTGVRTPKSSQALTPQQLALLDSYAATDDAGRAALQAVAQIALRLHAAPRQGNAVNIGGDVGQAITGDANFAAPVSFGRAKK